MLRTVLRSIFFTVTLSFLLTLHAHGACSVSTTGANFGAYDTLSAIVLDTTGSIFLSCDEAPPPSVVTAIGRSGNSGVFNPRQMKLTTGSDLMSYNLYTNNARTIIWGDGTGGTNLITTKVRKNRPVTLTVYGRVPAGQDVSVGTYSDTLVVTITW